MSPWIVCFWCLAHRLELSLQDALKNTFFNTIDDLLLRLYYLYQNSPKKCRELEDVVVSLMIKIMILVREFNLHVFVHLELDL